MATSPRRTDIDVQTEIDALASQGWKAAQIHRHLEKQKKFQGRVPSPRTVERSVKRGTPAPDTSGRWSLGDHDGADSRKILTILAQIIIVSGHLVKSFTKDEADWVLRLSHAARGLDPLRMWLLVKLYQRRLADESAGTEDLDAYVAFLPWYNDKALENYREEVSLGLKPVPMWDWLVEQESHYVEDGELFPGWPRARFVSWPEGIDDPAGE